MALAESVRIGTVRAPPSLIMPMPVRWLLQLNCPPP
jgi:hypothetical protein